MNIDQKHLNFFLFHPHFNRNQTVNLGPPYFMNHFLTPKPTENNLKKTKVREGSTTPTVEKL